jgi:hypothetical protein
MSRQTWRNRLGQVRHWRIAVVVLIALLAIVMWTFPVRETSVTSVDRRSSWSLNDAPPRREIVWQAALPIDGLLVKSPSVSVIAPSLTDAGATLFCTLQQPSGATDIYRSRFSDGKWAPAEPVDILNSKSDEIGAVVSADGKQLFFYSNRPGGYGGFDLYVSTRGANSWSKPRNLGERVNTAAHEYDPAIAPDGQSLYFASNRTLEMSQHAADSVDPKSTEKPWTSTLRSHPGLAQFDLYVVRQSENAWSSAEAIAMLNAPDSNEGAPFVSPDGVYLYFASDRPSRGNEETNLDLYRARIVDGMVERAEPLGTEINTDADETEPSLSPEGYRLVFSSNRDGRDMLYSSTAMEVMETSHWDTARLTMLRRVWPLALLITLVVAAVALMATRYRGPLIESAVAVRFFGASFVLHVVLLFILAFWSLPMVARVVLSKMQEATESTQPFDNNQHQSHKDGLEAWEKLADVKALEKSVELDRRETTPLNIPVDSAGLTPTISADFARHLPASKLLFVPLPKQVQVMRESTSLPKRPIPPADPIMEIAEIVERTVPTVAPSEERVALSEPEELNRLDAVVEVQTMPSRPMLNTIALQPIELTELQEESMPMPLATAELPSRTPAEMSEQIVELTEDETAPVIPVGKVNTLQTRVKQTSSLEQTVTNLPAAANRLTTIDDIYTPRVVSASALKAAKPTVRMPTEVARLRPRAVEVLDASDLSLVEEATPLADIASRNVDDPQVGVATVNLKQREHGQLFASVPTPDVMTGPSRLDRLLSVGELAEQRNEAPPTFNPIASRLNRRRAVATRVAYARESVGIQEMFTMRQSDVRKKYIKLLGSTEEAEEAVNRGLEWLAVHQNEDGSWSLHKFHENCKGKHANCAGAGNIPSNSAATGLALLPFLAAGHTHKEGDYQQTVDRALGWLGSIQKENGDLYAAGDQQHMYSHSIATIALCEAYGMSGDENLKPLAQLAIDFIVASQHKPTGGWRYEPNQAGDTSVVGWAMMALKSAEMAGLKPPLESYELVRKWLERVEGNKPIGGTFGYQNSSASPPMTAEGLLCLQFLGVEHDDPRMRAGTAYLMKNLPRTDQKNTSYYWYYGTQVMFHLHGDSWNAWNAQLRDHLVDTQRKDGSMAGTWDPRDNWENRAGRLYSTSLKLLMLEVYYRHLPLFNSQ